MTLTRTLTILGLSGLAVLATAFIPSPLRLLTAFDKSSDLAVGKPPPLVLQDLPPVSAYADIAARPIFNEGRRPDPATRPATTASSPAVVDQGELSEYRLVGIVADSVTQRAIVERAGSPSVRLSPGDRLAGWRIDKIDAKGIVASKDARSIRIAIPKSQPRTGTP